MTFDFRGKKFLVTGAGRCIGRELTKALVGAGGEVYALSITQENLDSLVEEVPGVHPIQCDLSDWEATERAVSKLGPLDGLVNNAGLLTGSPALETSKETLNTLLNVNLLAHINVSQIVGKKMVAAGKGGSIVNVSSILGLQPVPGGLAYGITKAALDMVTKQFALELGPQNIRVNAVNPHYLPTDMTAQYLSVPSNVTRIVARTPLRRIATIQDVVNQIMFLLSDLSTFISGTNNRVDGGLLSNIFVADDGDQHVA